jgi:hypothetical protein
MRAEFCALAATQTARPMIFEYDNRLARLDPPGEFSHRELVVTPAAKDPLKYGRLISRIRKQRMFHAASR